MPNEYLDPSQVTNLEDAASNPRDKLLVRLLFRLGCRVTEAISLTVNDIDFESGRVNIIHLKSRLWVSCHQCGARLGLRHDYCPKCGVRNEMNVQQRSEMRRQRSLPLDGETMLMVRGLLELNGPVIKNGKAYLFGINRHRAWQIVRQCADKAGLPGLVNPETGRRRGISPHRLRDAFAVHAMKTEWRPLQFLCQHY